MYAPAANSPCPIGTRHHPSARASRLTAPAPCPLAGVATTMWLPGPAGSGTLRSDTRTQSSTSGGEVQSQLSRAGTGMRSGNTLPARRASSGAANSSKITAAASGYPGTPMAGTADAPSAGACPDRAGLT